MKTRLKPVKKLCYGKQKDAHYLSGFQHESTHRGDLIFPSLSRRRDGHCMWSSKPNCDGLAVCRAKEVPSFLSYFKTLGVGPTPRIEPTTSFSTVKGSKD